MKEKETIIEIDGQQYKFVFNLNVLQIIQMEYGTYEKWGELTEGKNGETDIKALIFGIREMINEGIDIDNESREEKKPFFTEKQVGRIITKIGTKTLFEKIHETVINSTNDDSQKNE